jgi:hypothetical protein
VKARRLLRGMRGKARAHLIAADDGYAYVVKLSNNPQGGRRVLVNEFIGSVLLSHLGIATPERALVHIDEQCLSDSDPLPTGVHFGSRFPGPPDTVAVYDYWPDSLLRKVSNHEHLVGALMFDDWTSNADSRQAIFFRQFVGLGDPTATESRWVTQMIDNGSVFGGSDWTFGESPVRRTYGRRAVYGLDLSIRDFAPWLDALTALRPEVINEAVAEIPRDWTLGDEHALAGLLSQLWERRERVPAMIRQIVDLSQAGRLNLPQRFGPEGTPEHESVSDLTRRSRHWPSMGEDAVGDYSSPFNPEIVPAML